MARDRLGLLRRRAVRAAGAVRALGALPGRVEAASATLRRIETRQKRLGRRLERVESILEDEMRGMLTAAVSEDAENRRRLHRLRASAEYEAVFLEEDPLVSVTIPTRGRPELLRRALPSILAQTHQRLEVIVVGDAVAGEVAEKLDAVDDPRVRFANLTQRIVAHEDAARHHLVGSTMARNEGFRIARGSWLVAFDDDDAMHPDHVATLLAAARTDRLEVAYGRSRKHSAEGSVVRGGFPPLEHEAFQWQGALYHGGLRFFERELVAAAMRKPGDRFLAERMLRAGVRFGMVDQVVWDYHPSNAPRDATPLTRRRRTPRSSGR